MKRELASAANLRLQKRGFRPRNPLDVFDYAISLTISFPDQNFESVSASLVVLSKSSEPFPQVESKQAYTNFTQCVDLALGNLVGAYSMVIEYLPK